MRILAKHACVHPKYNHRCPSKRRADRDLTTENEVGNGRKVGIMQRKSQAKNTGSLRKLEKSRRWVVSGASR